MKNFNYKILYAEDDDQTRINYVEFFKLYFTDVYSAENGEEAYELYLENRPDIVILDINMPIVDGLSVAKKIKSIDEDTKIVMLTAFSEKEHFLDAIKIQVTDYLIKPIKISELESTLFNIVDKIEQNSKDILKLQDNILWDKNREILSQNGKDIKLSKKEQVLISLLCSNENATFETETILNYVWEDDIDKEYDTKALRALISRIKNKLGIQIFESIYNVGYKIKK